MALEKLYSVSEAAEELRISPWTLWAKLKNREIVRSKVGGRTVIRESELAKLIIDQPLSRNRKRRPRQENAGTALEAR